MDNWSNFMWNCICCRKRAKTNTSYRPFEVCYSTQVLSLHSEMKFGSYLSSTVGSHWTVLELETISTEYFRLELGAFDLN